MEHICKLARAIRIQAFSFVLQRVLVATQRRNRKMIETVGTSGYLGRIPRFNISRTSLQGTNWSTIMWCKHKLEGGLLLTCARRERLMRRVDPTDIIDSSKDIYPDHFRRK